MSEIERPQSKSPRGIYLLTGDDEFRKRLSLGRLKDKLLGANADAFNYNTYYARDAAINDIICSLETLPLTGSRKLIVVKDPEAISDDDKPRLITYLKNKQSDRTILVFTSRKISGAKDSLGIFLFKNAKVMSFESLKPNEVTAWIIKEFRARKKQINPLSADIIREAVQQDLGQALSMVEQISIFLGDREKVTDDDVHLFADLPAATSAFKLLDYINAKDTGSCLSILKSLLRSESNPYQIIGMLGAHVTRLISIKRLLIERMPKGDIASYMNIGTYALNRSIEQAQRFSLAQLRRQLKTLLDTDLMLKRTGIKGELLLEMLVVRLAS